MSKFFLLFLFNFSVIAHADVTSGLVGWWKLDEGSGTSVFDSSGNGSTGTLTSGPTWTQGKRGNAVSFDGTDDYIDATNNSVFDLTTTVSIAFWMKPNNVAHNGGMVCKWTAGGGPITNSYCVFIGDDAAASHCNFIIQQSNGTYIYGPDSTTLIANQWVHIIGVADGSVLKLYVNGVDVGSHVAYDGTLKVTTKKVIIGRLREDDTVYSFSGSLDDVRIYNRALTETEIKAIYLAGVNRQVIKGRAQLKNVRMK